MNFLAALDPNMFLYILQSISEGLSALGKANLVIPSPFNFNMSAVDTMVCAGCCATLDHIVTYLFKQWTLKSKQLYIRCEIKRNGGDNVF